MRRSARLAACLAAALATASCTSSNGLTPPMEVGSGTAPVQTTVGMAPSPTTASAALAMTPSDAAPASQAPVAAFPDSPVAREATQAPAIARADPSAAVPEARPQPGPAVSARLKLAPVIGPPQQAAASLGERLAARARQKGIEMGGAGTPTHVLRGYFSQLEDGNTTTVVYVWDVLDPAGNRLHRMQGQVKAKGKGGWSAVPAALMQSIADHTIDEFAQWLSGRGVPTAQSAG